MRKLSRVLAVALLSMSLTACDGLSFGGSDSASDKSSQTSTASETPSETASEAASEAPESAEESEAPSKDADANQEESDEASEADQADKAKEDNAAQEQLPAEPLNAEILAFQSIGAGASRIYVDSTELKDGQSVVATITGVDPEYFYYLSICQYPGPRSDDEERCTSTSNVHSARTGYRYHNPGSNYFPYDANGNSRLRFLAPAKNSENGLNCFEEECAITLTRHQLGHSSEVVAQVPVTFKR